VWPFSAKELDAHSAKLLARALAGAMVKAGVEMGSVVFDPKPVALLHSYEDMSGYRLQAQTPELLERAKSYIRKWFARYDFATYESSYSSPYATPAGVRYEDERRACETHLISRARFIGD